MQEAVRRKKNDRKHWMKISFNLRFDKSDPNIMVNLFHLSNPKDGQG